MISKSLRLSGCFFAISLASTILIPALQADIKVEVFIDNDPGHGNGTTFDCNDGENLLEISTADVAEGAHTISFRTKGESGFWSSTITRIFNVFTAQNADGAEYFIDEDPGAGRGTSFPLSGSDMSTFFVPTGDLSVGPHTLTVRLKTGESWSETVTKSFAVTPSSLLYEWFFDADPGVGNGSQLEASTGENTFFLPTETLQPGAHVFSSRVRDTAGRWSATTTHPLYVAEKVSGIVSAEYFVDADPGEGQGNHLALSEGGEASFVIPTADLSEGMHTLTLRGLDESDTWHYLYAAPFEVTIGNGVTSIEWKRQFDIFREGDNLRLVTKDIPAGSRISIVDMKGIVLYESELEDTGSQIIPVSPENGLVVVSIISSDGLRSVKTVKF